MQFILQGYGVKVLSKGEAMFQNSKCRWWLTTDPNQIEQYWVCFLTQQHFYFASFNAHKITPEMHEQFDDILSTFKNVK
jgi:hypothetical protein